MSTEQETTEAGPAAADAADATDPPKLRSRPFGYRKRDVHDALERQAAALGAREAELAELRQDIAALWLAFAQHDRMIRRALGEEAASRQASGGAPPAPAGETPAEAPAGQASGGAVTDEAAIGRQLSDLDDVLAAIELATQTLERTYVETAEAPPESGEDAKASPGEERT